LVVACEPALLLRPRGNGACGSDGSLGERQTPELEGIRPTGASRSSSGWLPASVLVQTNCSCERTARANELLGAAAPRASLGVHAHGNGSGVAPLWENLARALWPVAPPSRHVLGVLAFDVLGVLARGDGSGAAPLWENLARALWSVAPPSRHVLTFDVLGVLARGDGSGSAPLWDNLARAFWSFAPPSRKLLSAKLRCMHARVGVSPLGVLARGDGGGAAPLWEKNLKRALLVAGCWSLVVGRWSLVVGRWSVATLPRQLLSPLWDIFKRALVVAGRW
jgi:hypothetical protein